MGTIGLSEYSSPHLPLPAPLGDWGGGRVRGCRAIFQNVYLGGTWVKSGFWVGIGFLGGGDFFQVGFENSLYKK